MNNIAIYFAQTPGEGSRDTWGVCKKRVWGSGGLLGGLWWVWYMVIGVVYFVCCINNMYVNNGYGGMG